jgi:hypothetical protein
MPAPHFASISTLLLWAPQASLPRADPSAQSAERLMRGGKICCFSYRLQAVVEPASRKCSTLPMDPGTGVQSNTSLSRRTAMAPASFRGTGTLYLCPLLPLGPPGFLLLFGPRAFWVIGQNSVQLQQQFYCE